MDSNPTPATHADRRDYAVMLELAHQVALTPAERQWYRATRGMPMHAALDLIGDQS